MTSLLPAIFSAILEFFTGYLLKIKYFNKIRKIKAASKFREAFAKEINKCKSHGDFKIKAILFEAMPKHQEAVTLYEPFIVKTNLDSFKKVWEKYCQLHNSPILNELIPEAGIGKEGYIREITESEQRKLSLSHLNKLINYAPNK